MKALVLLTALIVGTVSGLDIPQGQLITSMKRDNAKNYPGNQNQTTVTYEKAPGSGETDLTVSYTGTLMTIRPFAALYPADLEKLGAGSYAILGEMKAESVGAGSRIILWWRTFPLGTEDSTKLGLGVPALDATGNEFKLQPSDDWQPFWIPFDTKVARPIWLGVVAYLNGPSTIHFRNMRLVEYPSETPTTKQEISQAKVFELIKGSRMIEMTLQADPASGISYLVGTYVTPEPKSLREDATEFRCAVDLQLDPSLLGRLKAAGYNGPLDAGASAASQKVVPPSAPSMQLLASLPGDVYVSPQLSLERDTSVAFPVADDGTKGLTLTWTGHESQTQEPLLDLSPELLQKVTTSRFGLVGEARTSHTASLDMELGFVPSTDPPPKIEAPHTDVMPTTEWRPFELQFDRRNSSLVLDHLQLWADVYATGGVRALPTGSNSPPPVSPDATVLELRHLQLVQYVDAPPLVSVPSSSAPTPGDHVTVQITSSPNGAPPTLSLDETTCPDMAALQAALTERHQADPNAYLTVRADKSVPYESLRQVLDAVKNEGFQNVAIETLPPTSAAEPTVSAPAIDWRSFTLGALATVGTLLGLAGLIFLSRLWQRRHHERELRRIASLDT